MLAALSGAFMALQGALNATLGRLVGTWNAVLLSSLLATVLVLAVAAPTAVRLLSHPGHLPWYLYLGGPLVAAITYLVILTVPRLGMANATTAILLGQLATAFLVDHFGLFGLNRHPFQWLNLLGLLLLAAGARILLGN